MVSITNKELSNFIIPFKSGSFSHFSESTFNKLFLHLIRSIMTVFYKIDLFNSSLGGVGFVSAIFLNFVANFCTSASKSFTCFCYIKIFILADSFLTPLPIDSTIVSNSSWSVLDSVMVLATTDSPCLRGSIILLKAPTKLSLGWPYECFGFCLRDSERLEARET